MADTIQHTDNNRPAAGTTVVHPEGGGAAAQPAPNAQNKSRTFNFEGLQINLWYFRSVPGILKIIQWVFGIVCIACASPPIFDAGHWFVFVAVFCFIFTFIWVCIHVFSLTSVINLPWLLLELGYTCLASFFYFIAFIVLLIETTKFKYLHYHVPWSFIYINYDSNFAAGSFGVFNFIVYSMEALWHAKTYLDVRRSA
ncbi:hypothetical protein CHUAL_004561 [Chamberlinius hualienensis]